jgi:hypothetical protein
MDVAFDILVRRYGVARMTWRRKHPDGRVERSRRLRERGGSMIATTFTPEQTGVCAPL